MWSDKSLQPETRTLCLAISDTEPGHRVRVHELGSLAQVTKRRQKSSLLTQVAQKESGWLSVGREYSQRSKCKKDLAIRTVSANSRCVSGAKG
jgi:hypothetical protein